MASLESFKNFKEKSFGGLKLNEPDQELGELKTDQRLYNCPVCLALLLNVEAARDTGGLENIAYLKCRMCHTYFCIECCKAISHNKGKCTHTIESC